MQKFILAVIPALFLSGCEDPALRQWADAVRKNAGDDGDPNALPAGWAGQNCSAATTKQGCDQLQCKWTPGSPQCKVNSAHFANQTSTTGCIGVGGWMQQACTDKCSGHTSTDILVKPTNLKTEEISFAMSPSWKPGSPPINLFTAICTGFVFPSSTSNNIAIFPKADKSGTFQCFTDGKQSTVWTPPAEITTEFTKNAAAFNKTQTAVVISQVLDLSQDDFDKLKPRYNAAYQACTGDLNCGLNFNTGLCVELPTYCKQFTKEQCDGFTYANQKASGVDDKLQLADGTKCTQDGDTCQPAADFKSCSGQWSVQKDGTAVSCTNFIGAQNQYTSFLTGDRRCIPVEGSAVCTGAGVTCTLSSDSKSCTDKDKCTFLGPEETGTCGYGTDPIIDKK